MSRGGNEAGALAERGLCAAVPRRAASLRHLEQVPGFWEAQEQEEEQQESACVQRAILPEL